MRLTFLTVLPVIVHSWTSALPVRPTTTATTATCLLLDASPRTRRRRSNPKGRESLRHPYAALSMSRYLTTLEEAASSSSSASSSQTLPLANGSAATASEEGVLPLEGLERGTDGIYRITNKEEHAALLAAHPDKLVVLKVFAPWCRACKGLEPKFIQIANDEKLKELPLLFAQLSIQHNKDFVKSIGVLALPTVQFYVGGALHDNFPCGPSKLPILKRKLAQLVNDHVDPTSGLVNEASIARYQQELARMNAGVPVSVTGRGALPANATESIGSSVVDQTTLSDTTVPAKALPPIVTAKERRRIRASCPYLADLSLADYDEVMDKARLLTFEPKSIIMREGKGGRTFYILQRGEVEICQATSAVYDPLVVPTSYLGTVINRLEEGDYFGERALITGEPRAASIRATDQRVTCWALDRDDFPWSSPLSGRTKATDQGTLESVNDKYGVSLDEMYQNEAKQQSISIATASQTRGSVNRPAPIRGVDNDEVEEEDAIELVVDMPVEAGVKVGEKDAIFTVLRRFQLIRQVSKCFDYIVETRAQWGTAGIRKRREFLVNRLRPSQLADFQETFRLIDASGDGLISLLELKRVMDSVGDVKTDEELLQILQNASLDGEQVMNGQDLEGLMAEAEFYYLFRDVFATLDTQDSGFVKASDLDRILCGVRDLISSDHKSLIDVEGDDVLIDYERFSRMLLGTTLL
jgi:calmodulin